MHAHTCGSPCSRRAAHVTRCMVTICMSNSLALYCPERSTTAHTSHSAHALLHWLSLSRSLVHSTVACTTVIHGASVGGVAPAWVMAEGMRPMW